jgi:hypothetical protein
MFCRYSPIPIKKFSRNRAGSDAPGVFHHNNDPGEQSGRKYSGITRTGRIL